MRHNSYANVLADCIVGKSESYDRPLANLRPATANYNKPMDKTREEGDTRSAKRHAHHAHGTAPRSAARAVAELDDAIWTSIIEFMPIPRDLQPSDQEKHVAAVAEFAKTWRTLLHMRLVNKKLASLLHPEESAALWRRLALQSFDFSTHPGSQAEIYGADHRCLEEDIVEWGALVIYHRSSQYGFLTTLQRQPPEGEWPESEDAFTLFGDLVQLLQLPPGEDMGTHGEGGDTTVKYLAAPAYADSRSATRRVCVMKTLGYVPRTWDRGRGIGKKWKGFTTAPDAFETHVAAQEVERDENKDWEEDEDCDEEDEGWVEDKDCENEDCDGEDEDWVEDKDWEDDEDCDEEDDDWVEDEPFEESEEFGFPDCSLRDAKRLSRHIRQHYRDWRSVCCNSGWDGRTPVFFVGESKAAPHRWTGYTGLKCWT